METLRRLSRGPRRAIASLRFPGSRLFWEENYKRGGSSGSGSRGQLARYKADIVNGLVDELGIGSVVDFGCGDGYQLGLARYPRYLGLDVSPTAVRMCIERFADDPSKSFALYDPETFDDPAGFVRADMALSLDVLFHVVEDRLFDLYLSHLFDAAERVVVIYAPDEARATAVPYSTVRPFTPWIAKNRPEWRRLRRIPNPSPATWSEFFVFGR